MESEAILAVLKMGQMKRIVIAGSDILELEITRMSDENKKRKVQDLYKVADIGYLLLERK